MFRTTDTCGRHGDNCRSTVSVTIVNFRVVRSTPPRTCTVCPVLYIAFPLCVRVASL